LRNDSGIAGKAATSFEAGAAADCRESLEPGALVATVARSHRVNANEVFHWCKLLREGQLDEKPVSLMQLMPVRSAEVVGDADKLRGDTQAQSTVDCRSPAHMCMKNTR
jgi:transposase-like protein